MSNPSQILSLIFDTILRLGVCVLSHTPIGGSIVVDVFLKEIIAYYFMSHCRV
jgi:hypothetical protein